MKLLIAAIALTLSIACGSAVAVEISPLTTVFAPAESKGALTLRNPSSTPKTFQIFSEEWVVIDGKRIARPATDLVLVPSLITVPAGKTQVVRFLRTGPETGEKVYRLGAQEIIHPDLAKQPGLHQILRINWNWVWRPAGANPALTVHREGNELVFRNTGSATAQIVNVKSAAGVLHEGLLDYVMPGTEVRLPLDGKAVPASISLRLNGKDTDLAVQ